MLELTYTFNMFPAKAGFSAVSATQLGICKGELLKLLELRILVLAQINDLHPKHKQTEVLQSSMKVGFFP